MKTAEPVLPLTAAPALVAELTGAPPPSYETVGRWAIHGLRGKRLRTRRVGGRVYFTRADLEQFLGLAPATAGAE
jgi:hypothetical protein